MSGHYESVIGGPPTRVVAVIPAFNEERFIASVVITTLYYVQHVIVVDDGSTDRTALLAEKAGAEVVRLPQNGGKGRALSAGFERALCCDPDVIIMLDGDAQHDPAEIPNLIEPILQKEADVVIGSRFLQIRSRIPLWRRFGQAALTHATNIMSGLFTTDSQSGYRAFAPKVLDNLHLETTGLAAESEMQFLLDGSLYRVTDVPISVQYRDGNKRNPLVHGLEVVDAIVSLVARRRPLLLIGAPGIILTAAGLLEGLFVVQTVNVERVVPVGTALLSVGLILTGLLLSATSLILNTMERLIERLREELRAMPGPIVRVDE